jgi:chorismate mutase
MDDEKALLFIREEIDSIDSEIIDLLESRLNLSLQIGNVKKNLGKELHDDEREELILKKIDELAILYPKEDLKSIFLEIMKTSLSVQQPDE